MKDEREIEKKAFNFDGNMQKKEACDTNKRKSKEHLSKKFGF